MGASTCFWGAPTALGIVGEGALSPGGTHLKARLPGAMIIAPPRGRLAPTARVPPVVVGVIEGEYKKSPV